MEDMKNLKEIKDINTIRKIFDDRVKKTKMPISEIVYSSRLSIGVIKNLCKYKSPYNTHDTTLNTLLTVAKTFGIKLYIEK